MTIFRTSFFGLGRVGLTIGSCFASKGIIVTGFDIDRRKIDLISCGKPPFYEPGLDELLKYDIEHHLLRVTVDPVEAVLNSDITFITVNTPNRNDGTIDLTLFEKALKDIGTALQHKNKWHLVVIKSTVIPTTTESIAIPKIEGASGKRCGTDFGVCVNPEFIREGHAIEDTFKPDRIIIGEVDRKSGETLEIFYRKFYDNQMPQLLRTTPVNAELIKYANNVFLAMKVSFINMIANLCQKLPKADVEDVAKGIGWDRRIGELFLRAGAGWGGSCWPKDLRAILNFGVRKGVRLPLIEATLEVNEEQPYRVIELAKELVGDLRGRRVSVLGLAFKPNTDDMRDAVSIKIIKKLLENGVKVTVYDPKAMDNAKRIFGYSVDYADTIENCLQGSECALIVTEWDEFRNLKPEDFIKLMKIPAIIDGRRIYNPTIFSPKVKYKTIGLGLI